MEMQHADQQTKDGHANKGQDETTTEDKMKRFFQTKSMEFIYNQKNH